MNLPPDSMIPPYFPRGVCYNPGSVAAPSLVRPLSDLGLILVYLITVAIFGAHFRNRRKSFKGPLLAWTRAIDFFSPAGQTYNTYRGHAPKSTATNRGCS